MIIICFVCALLIAILTLLAMAGYSEVVLIVLLCCAVFMVGMIVGSVLDD